MWYRRNRESVILDDFSVTAVSWFFWHLYFYYTHSEYNQLFLIIFFDMLTYTLLQIIGPPESPLQTPPSFLVNLVHIMWWKVEPQIFSHSLLNCVFFVASFRTFEGRKSPPVRPQPTTWHLTLAGVFPFFLGSLMIFTNLFSVAFFFLTSVT